MSHLPPPPPNAAPYAPPPPQYGQPPYQQYPQQGYQQYAPPPPPAAQQNGYGQHRPPPPNGNHQHSGHDRPQKSKMVVTKYPRPPNRQQHGQQYPGPPPPGPYGQAPPPPPAAAPYSQPPTWNQPPPPAHGQPLMSHPPPPHYAQPQPAPSQYSAPPPPQQQAPYSGYQPQPPAAYPPPPAAQAAYPPPPAQPAAYAPPPLHSTPGPQWSQPATSYPPQGAYSPTPSVANYQAPPAPVTPAQAPVHAPPPRPPSVPHAVKDRSDPTFYDGWDDGEFEYGGNLWIPPKGDTSHDALSLGQYTWHAPQQITRAITTKIDEPVEVATVDQKYDPRHFVIASKYYDTVDADGHEYVFNFQRIRYVDEWKERKNDPLYKRFTHAELHEDVVPADEVFKQVLERPKEIDEVDAAAEMMANLTGYLNGTKGGSGKNLEAENLLASLGVTGSAKPVFATPFPAYNPPPGESPKPQESVPQPKRDLSATPAPARGGFNPFKIASNASRQPTPRANGFGAHPPPSSRPTPQPHFSQPSGHVQQRYSPVHQPPAHQAPAYQPPVHQLSGHQPAPQTSVHQASAHQPPPYHRETPPQGQRLVPPPPPPPPTHSNNHGPRSPAKDNNHYNRSDRYRSRRSPAHDERSPVDSGYDDPWRTSNGHHREMTPVGPATPAGSDFGDLTPTVAGANTDSYASSHRTPSDSHDHSSKKRKMESHGEARHNKRRQSKPNVESAYQRRW